MESSNRSPSKRSSCEKQGPKHLDNQASVHLSLAEEQALFREFLEETDVDSDDDFFFFILYLTIIIAQEFVLT